MRNATFGIGDSPDGLPAGDYVTLSVSDTGAGMSEDVRAMAFEPFFTTKGPGEGSGLGLSMVLGVATQSGGGVRINSQPGSGTSIQVLLPRTRTEAFSAEMEAEASLHHSAEVREEVVLVVDDDRYVRQATTAILASLGYRVIEVSSGPAAIEILARGERVDLMLVDIGMPGMNGIDAMRGAREQRPDLPVLFATGYADAVSFSNGDIDRNCLLGKPFRRDELFRRIQACMGEGTS
jgi:CheY-like chemotaxis protein